MSLLEPSIYHDTSGLIVMVPLSVWYVYVFVHCLYFLM